MLKKIIAASAMCAFSCGISFGKIGALDIMEFGAEGIAKSGITYRCVGDNSHATCYFKDIDTLLFQVKNMRTEAWLTDNQWKSEISGDIVVNLNNDSAVFMPKSFRCENTEDLKDLQNLNNGRCVITSDVATLSIDSKALSESKTYRYKTMPTIFLQYITKIERLSKEYDRIQTQYHNKVAALQQKVHEDLDDIQTEIDMLATAEMQNNGYRHSCGHKSTSPQENLMRQKQAIKKNYNIAYDEIVQQYEDDMAEWQQSVVTWLNQYNFAINEVRVYTHTNKLAETAFGVFAKEYFMFNENIPLTKQEQKERDEQKKQLTAQYYAGLEAMRAASITFIEQSPYLEEHLKESLQKIVAEYAKLFDPNAHKRSVKILITPKNNNLVKLGDEAQKLIAAYNTKGNKETEMFQALFDIINRYDIKAVKLWPEQQQ